MIIVSLDGHGSEVSSEAEVGIAVATVPRSSIVVTTKLGHADRIEERLEESVSKISGDGYVNLFLIHALSAGPIKRKEQWAALESLVERGRTESIGVSN